MKYYYSIKDDMYIEAPDDDMSWGAAGMKEITKAEFETAIPPIVPPVKIDVEGVILKSIKATADATESWKMVDSELRSMIK